MNIRPVAAVETGQSQLGCTKIMIILNISIKMFGESLDTDEYPRIIRS